MTATQDTVKITLAPLNEFPENYDDRCFFDTSNGCYYHSCGCLTSWFRRNDAGGWTIQEWATWLNPAFTGPLCDELASFTGEGLFEVIAE